MDSGGSTGLVIEPMGIGGVLDTGLALARRNYSVFVRTAAYGVVPAYVLGAILALALNVSGLMTLILSIGTAFAGLALTIACAHEIAPTGQIDELQPGPLYQAALSRIGTVILYAIMVIILAIPLLIIFPLGIFLGVRWSQSWYAVIIEGSGPIESLGRSWNLTRGSWWHTLGVGLVAAILIGLVDFVLGLVFGIIGALIIFAGGATVGTIISNLGSALGTIFVEPYALAIAVVLFFELRARSEGLDLVTRASQAPG
jgi:hypothetical protein